MRNFFFATLAGILLVTISACKKQLEGTKIGDKGRLVIHTKGNSPKIDHNNLVSIQLKSMFGDTVFSDTERDYHGPREMFIPLNDSAMGPLPPFMQAIMMLAEGDSATFYETLDTNDVKRAQDFFKRKATEIVTHIKILKVTGSEETNKRKADVEKVPEMVAQTIADYKAGKLKDQIQKTESGLEYVIHEKGAGKLIQDGWIVPTNYYGALLADGKMFDSSYSRGGPADFTVGQMIPGFNEGMKLLTKGSKATLFIPWKIAYGEQGIQGGPIGPKADLVFYIHVE